MIHNYHNVSYTATVFCSVLFWEPQSPVFDPKLTFFFNHVSSWRNIFASSSVWTFVLSTARDVSCWLLRTQQQKHGIIHSCALMMETTEMAKRKKKLKQIKHLWNKVRSIRAVYGETVRYREIQYLWHSHGKRIYIIWQCISKHQGRTSYL